MNNKDTRTHYSEHLGSYHNFLLNTFHFLKQMLHNQCLKPKYPALLKSSQVKMFNNILKHNLSKLFSLEDLKMLGV